MSDAKLRILDTSTVSYIQRGQEPWCSRLRALPPEQRAIPVVTVEEQMRGRLSQITRANQKGGRNAIVQAYARLEEALTFFHTVWVLPFDEAAADY